MKSMREMIKLMEGVMSVPGIGQNNVVREDPEEDREDALYQAIAALYGPNIWDYDGMYQLVQDLEAGNPTDQEIQHIITTGQLPERLANLPFTRNDDLQFGSDNGDWGGLEEKAPPGEEGLVKDLKKEYPGHEEKAFATAWSIYNKKHGKTENKDPLEEINKSLRDRYVNKAVESSPETNFSKAMSVSNFMKWFYTVQNMDPNHITKDDVTSLYNSREYAWEHDLPNKFIVDAALMQLNGQYANQLRRERAEKTGEDNMKEAQVDICHQSNPATADVACAMEAKSDKYFSSLVEPGDPTVDDNELREIVISDIKEFLNDTIQYGEIPMDHIQYDSESADNFENIVSSNDENLKRAFGAIRSMDEYTRPEQFVKVAKAALKILGQPVSEDFDLNNGYDSEKYLDGQDYFPNGADGPVVKATGPSGARQGDNPEQKKMQIDELHKELVYGYRKHLAESKKKKSLR